MKETTLLKIALACALVGLLALYFISARIEIKEYNTGKLAQNVGDDVKLTGTITKLTDKGNFIFIEVSHQSPVNVVLFTDDNNLKLNKGDNVDILGKVQEYNGKPEIIADKVRVVK